MYVVSCKMFGEAEKGLCLMRKTSIKDILKYQIFILLVFQNKCIFLFHIITVSFLKNY